MISVFAAAFLAASLPTDQIDSVALAAYWYKKDERGVGDSISEQGKPKRYPAFAISEDTFLVRDPFVRAKHLDRIEILFRGEVLPAKEVARIEEQEAVVVRSERPVPGVKPLVFASTNAPVSGVSWRWEHDSFVADPVGAGTNDHLRVVIDSGKAYRQGERDTLYLDRDRAPVSVDFGARRELVDGKIDFSSPAEWKRVPAESFESDASAIERKAAEAALGLVIRLEPEEKEESRGGMFSFRIRSYDDDGPGKNEIDTWGFAVGDKIVAPCNLKGEAIARLKTAEATFPDGSVTNLVFAGTLAEWNAILFTVPAEFAGKLKPLALAEGDALSFDNGRAWIVEVENENGRIVTTAGIKRFDGVTFLRGARFVPGVRDVGDFDREEWRHRSSPSYVLDGDGRLVCTALARRFSSQRWRENEVEAVAAEEFRDILAGKAYNPEFAPRSEDDRHRFVWLGVDSARLTDALAREKKAQSYLANYSRPPYITEVYPDSPAEKAGLKVGDILLALRRGNEGERELEASYGYSSHDWGSYFESESRYVPDSTPWPDVEDELNRMFSAFGTGAKVTIIYARDGERKEAEVTLAAAPVHYASTKKVRNRTLGLSVKDMTFEVRRYFKFDESEPGVVIARVKPGSPAAVAGLKPYELVTEVNGEKVVDAKDFAAKVKDKADLLFSVRRLAKTRMVKIHVDLDTEKDKERK